MYPKKKEKKKVNFWIYFVFLFVVGVFVYIWNTHNESRVFYSDDSKQVDIILEGVVLGAQSTRANTVEEFLEQNSIQINDKEILPPLTSSLHDGMRVYINRKKTVFLTNGGEESEKRTDMRNVQDFLYENSIALKENDFVLPSIHASLSDGDEIQVVRVEIEQESVFKDIQYTTIIEKDEALGWQEENIKQKGKKGQKEKIYNVVYHDGEEIERNFIEEKITREPVTKVIVQGTYVKLGKKHTGWGTWYAHTGTMAAASPWLPLGSHAKVTNRENGKSVIVKINDRGPFGENRIIDLDKVAFAEIASLGAGIIDVKVEEIEN